MRFLSIFAVATILCAVPSPALGQSLEKLLGDLPETVPIGLSADFEGTAVEYLGRVTMRSEEQRIERIETFKEFAQSRGKYIGYPAAYAHTERDFSSDIIKLCENGQSVAAFFMVLDDVYEWTFPSNTTLQIIRSDGEIFTAEKVFRARYEFNDGWLDLSFEDIGLDRPVSIRPNPIATDLSRDLQAYDGRFYSPSVLRMDDDILVAFFAVLPQRSESGQQWPKKDRSSFNMRMVSTERSLP